MNTYELANIRNNDRSIIVTAHTSDRAYGADSTTWVRFSVWAFSDGGSNIVSERSGTTMHFYGDEGDEMLEQLLRLLMAADIWLHGSDMPFSDVEHSVHVMLLSPEVSTEDFVSSLRCPGWSMADTQRAMTFALENAAKIAGEYSIEIDQTDAFAATVDEFMEEYGVDISAQLEVSGLYDLED